MTTVLVVGGGIAGWSAAWFAMRRGASVTLIDAGVDRASDLPVALVNPVRGRQGRVVARGIEGMKATFALVDGLVADGHSIVHGRGVFRPLPPGSRDRATWAARLPDDLRWRWHDEAPPTLGLVDAGPALELPEAGWIAPRGLLDALTTCGARRVHAEALRVDPTSVELAGGERLTADRVVWCGGAWGASRLDRSPAHEELANDDGHYRPGSLVVAPGTLTAEALAFGLYAVPLDPRHGIDADALTILGPTREASRNAYPEGEVMPEAIEALRVDIAAVLRAPAAITPLWRGVRLSRLSSRARAQLADLQTITTLGSRGYLMAPLFAAEWAASL